MGGLGLLLFLVLGIPIIVTLLDTNPTCFDKTQNQDEVGVDCGGVCTRLCSSQVHTLKTLWSRSFRVSEGRYNSVAYIENPNFDAGVHRIAYSFKLFDDRNILVAERVGETFISTNAITPIFEAAIDTGNRVPARTFFEFREAPVWERAENIPGLETESVRMTNEERQPRIDALIVNDSVNEIFNIEVVATAFDSEGNAIGVSQTTIERLDPRSSQAVVFTWPRPFGRSVSRIDVVPRIPLKQVR